MVLIDFFFDFETRSRLDLKKVGTVNYAKHSSTEATLITWAFGKGGEVKYWRLGQPIPQELIHVAENPEKFHHIAFNVLFDFMIWTQVFKRLIPTMKAISIHNLSCAMALSNYNRLGSSLDSCAMALRLPYSKDKEGHRIMLKQCKPKTTGADKGQFPTLTAAEESHFIRYGIIDTKLLRECYYRMVSFTASERWGFEWTLLRNLRGVRIDMPLLDVLERVLNAEFPRLRNEFERLTGFGVNQTKRCTQYFGRVYGVKNMQAETIADIFEAGVHPCPVAKRALEIKAEVGSTSLAKVSSARRLNYDGRIYDLWNFVLAQTRRWAGKGVQPQNFPRPNEIIGLEDLNVEDLAERVLKITSGDWCQTVKDLLRKLWVPDFGKYFYCGDFSKIEPTVLFWLLNLGAIPKNIYEIMAAEIYKCSPSEILKGSEKRTVGKGAFLGSGYGQGPAGFQKQQKKNAGLKLELDVCKDAVYAYRRKYFQVPIFWKQLEAGFRSALAGHTVSLCDGKVHILPMDKPVKGVKVRLPSGSHLFYPGAGQGKDGLYYEVVYRKQLVKESTYGGKLCENVCSAIARDIMLSSMYKLEAAGFENLGTVHDEVWSQNSKGKDKEYEATMCSIPRWCGNMHVTVESENGVRYLK